MSFPPSDPWGMPASSSVPPDPTRSPPGPAEPPASTPPAPGVAPPPGSMPTGPGWHTQPPPSAYAPPPSPGPYPPLSGPPGQIIVQIAEIGVTSTVVHTPAGDLPLAGSHWQVNDYWINQQRTPQWAIVAAIAGFCVLTVFSLLFLLIKETVVQGTVQVTVTNGQRQYVARIPVYDQNAVAYINQQVNYVRTLAAL